MSSAVAGGPLRGLAVLATSGITPSRVLLSLVVLSAGAAGCGDGGPDLRLGETIIVRPGEDAGADAVADVGGVQACDLRTGDGCGDGEACLPGANDSAACGPAGDLEAGASCGRLSDETCAAGLVCVAVADDERICRTWCSRGADCEVTEICQRITGLEAQGLGVCVPMGGG